MDPQVVSGLVQTLADIEMHERVAIPLAIESGSRAWGFPSPDSDYDCRFVFVRPHEDTYTLFPMRDVIERPITSLVDVSGWELSKAIRLLLKGNAVIVEWLTSPFAYAVNDRFRREFLELAHDVLDRRAVRSHYFHLGSNQIRRFLDNPADVALKKVLYSLRPMMAIRWLDRHPGEAVAPMHFPTLCAEADIDAELMTAIDQLLEAKAVTRELGNGDVAEPIWTFLRNAYDRGLDEREHDASEPDENRSRRADAFWRRWVAELGKQDRKDID